MTDRLLRIAIGKLQNENVSVKSFMNEAIRNGEIIHDRGGIGTKWELVAKGKGWNRR